MFRKYQKTLIVRLRLRPLRCLFRLEFVGTIYEHEFFNNIYGYRTCDKRPLNEALDIKHAIFGYVRQVITSEIVYKKNNFTEKGKLDS